MERSNGENEEMRNGQKKEIWGGGNEEMNNGENEKMWDGINGNIKE